MRYHLQNRITSVTVHSFASLWAARRYQREVYNEEDYVIWDSLRNVYIWEA